MDVCSVSTAKAQSMSLTTVGTAMLNKSLETMDSMGQGLMKMMESSLLIFFKRTISSSVS